MTDKKETFVHPIFKHDPKEWLQYVYKKVSVVTKEDDKHEGWVYTIDPVSQSIVLVQFVDEQIQLSIIMREAVDKTTILDETDPTVKNKLDSLFRPEAEIELSSEELKAKKLKLKSWLEKNRLPLHMTGDQNELLSIAAGALTILPPYGLNNCQCTNEIILGRIQGLIKNMPEDHDQW